MKNAVVALALIVASNFAQATTIEIPMHKAYTLETFSIDKNSELADYRIVSGTVETNLKFKQLRLVLQPAMNCPGGRMCAQVMPEPVTINLPIVYIGSGFCGGTIITARRDHRPADGNLVEVTVVDDSTNICVRPQGVPQDRPVNVTLTETTARGNRTATSQMSGFPIFAQDMASAE